MTNLFTSKTNFSSGELSQNLLGRVDLKAYDNGAMELKNIFIEPTGGVYRRPGLKYIATLSGIGRLIAFEENSSTIYIIVLKNETLDIYLNGTLQTTLTTPWTSAQINDVRWCQGADTLYLVHPEIEPRILTHDNDTWTLATFTFLTDEDCLLQPYHKYVADDITIASSRVTGNVTLTASEDVFQSKHVNRQFKIAEGYVRITAVTDSTHASGTVLKKLVEDADGSASLTATRSWGEPAFDSDYGYPTSVAFYQSRLVFGGSKKLPNYIWFSQSGDLTNFELGDGYDSEGIEFNILSDQANRICALFSGRHLQIFTTNSEWMVSGDPLTPTSIQLKRQTQVGFPDYRYIPPIGIDGATIFPAANGHEIREFLFADIEDAYQATDLSLMSGHLIDKPQDQAYDKENRQAYIIMQDGTLAVLTSFRAEDIQSWSRAETNGKFCSVISQGGKTFFIVKRSDTYYLEQLDESFHTDCAFSLSSGTPTFTFSNLSVLEGKTVKVVADGIPITDRVITDGVLTLDTPAKQVEVGLGFQHRLIPLPPSIGASNGSAPVSSSRLVKATFRVIDTESLEVDTGTGLHQALTKTLDSYVLDSVSRPKTQDIVIRSIGWKRNPTAPLWYISGEVPKSFKLVSVTTDLQIGG